MNDEIFDARQLVELGYLEDILVAMGYQSVRLVEKGPESQYHSLLVELPTNGGAQPLHLVLSFYPLPEYENTLFLQYCVYLPLTLTEEMASRLYPYFSFLNHLQALGTWAINDESVQITLRYVQAHNSSDLLTQERVEDVISLFSSAAVLFSPIVAEVANGSIDLESAKERARDALR